MSEFFQTFDLFDPTVEDFDYMTLARIQEIRKRWLDTHGWGIIRDNSYLPTVNVPVSVLNLSPNRKWNILQFPIRLNVATGEFNVGEGSVSTTNPNIVGGVAYDINGERIAILDDAAFDFSNDSPYGTKSSGNLGIPLTLTGTTGTCEVNPAVPGTYYVWVEALNTNLPQAVVGEDGVTHYPEITDGYRIRMTGTPVAPSGDGVSVFLCKIIWVGGAGTLTVTDGLVTDGSNSIDTAPAVAGDPHRLFSALRDTVVEIDLDETAKTTDYTSDGKLRTLRDHINAIGGGSPTPNNAHGLTLADIPGAGEEPIATNNQRDSLNKGIVDLNAAQNSPARNGDALQPSLNRSDLDPEFNGALDNAVRAAGVTPTLKDGWVRIKDLDNATKTKAAFLLGFRLKRLAPNLRTTNFSGDPSINPADPETGDGWIGFANEDTSGVYILFGQKITLDADDNDALLVNKVPASRVASSLSDAQSLLDSIFADGIDRIVLGQVYWDGFDLFRNPTQPPITDSSLEISANIDQRSLGLVGPQQISSEAKNDPVTGALAAQVFEQQAANSNYALGAMIGTLVTDNVREVDFGAAKVILIGAAITPAEPGLADPPVGAITGRKWTTNAGAVGSLAPSYVFHILKNLKPGRFYGISFFYKASSGFNDRLRVGIADANTAAPNSLITLDGISSVDPIDITILNDAEWHRASLVVKTVNGVDPDPAVFKYLEFLFQQGGIASTAGTFAMTNIQVTEGEWIPGYMGSKYVPSGGIIMWDQSSSCPAGYQEITGLANRFPVGQGTVAVGAGAGSFNPATAGFHTHGVPAGTTSSEIGIPPAINPSTVLAVPFGAPVGGPQFVNPKHEHSTPVLITGSASSGVTPYYALIFCRAI